MGHSNSPKNSIEIYYEIFQHHNIKYFYELDPYILDINGKLRGDTFILEQCTPLRCILGLILAAPLLDGNSNINFKNNKFEKHINLLIDIMKEMGYLI